MARCGPGPVTRAAECVALEIRSVRSALEPWDRIRMTCSRLAPVAAVTLVLAGCGHEAPPSPICRWSGVDISHHQDVIDWPAVARSGVSFVWIKATEGGDYLDPAFRRNWFLAGVAGLHRGAYHFVSWCRPSADQARWFAMNVPDDPDALPPVLDVEWNPESKTCPGTVPKEMALAKMRTILAAMERATGRRPIIYAPRDFFGQVMDGALSDYPLWIRGLGHAPPAEYGGRPWVVWQHSETGTVPGIKGAVDLDCAEGPLR